MRKIIFIIIIILLANIKLEAYNVIYPSKSSSAGNILLDDFSSAIFINNSFSAFKKYNTLIFSAVLRKNSLLEELDDIKNLGGVISITSLRKYFNIDVAFNMLDYMFYKNYLFNIGISRTILDNIGVGIVVKYGGESFTLTYDNEYDSLFTGNSLTLNNYNFDVGVSYSYKDSIYYGLSFENVLSFKEFFDNRYSYDMNPIVRANISAKMFNFSIFNNNYIGSEIDLSTEYLNIKTGISLGFYKFFSLQAGYISNRALSTGINFYIRTGLLKFNIGYAMNYLYNINNINNTATIKIKF